MAGWKPEEGGMWIQPGTGFKYDQDIALKIEAGDPEVSEEIG
jgi:hypothetical protein